MQDALKASCSGARLQEQIHLRTHPASTAKTAQRKVGGEAYWVALRHRGGAGLKAKASGFGI